MTRLVKVLTKLLPVALALGCLAASALAHDKIKTVVAAPQNTPGFGKDSQGNLYFRGSGCIIQVKNAVSATISTFAGQPPCGYSGDGGPALQAQFNDPGSIAFDAAGNAYIADTYNCAIRRIDAQTHIVSTVAGGPFPESICGNDYEGYAGDGDGGPATQALLFYPADASLDAAGNIYIADTANLVIREVFASSGIIDTVPNYGEPGGYIGNGFGSDGPPEIPFWVQSDPNGNLFIADPGSQVIFWLTPSHTLIDIAGIPMYSSFPEDPCPGSFYGDGGPALEADFNVPTAVGQDSAGNFYVVDSCNNRLRQISAFAGFGLSTSALTFEPQQVGTPSSAQTITVSAIGPTKFGFIILSHGFKETDNCTYADLSPGQACQIQVTFDPKSTGPISGKLKIYSNAFLGSPEAPGGRNISGGNPDEVSLNGTAHN